jgi:hypothetical protein
MAQMVMQQPNIFQRIYRFYIDGFRSMTLGKTLWKIVIIKLIIMFAVLKLFFSRIFWERTLLPMNNGPIMCWNSSPHRSRLNPSTKEENGND